MMSSQKIRSVILLLIIPSFFITSSSLKIYAQNGGELKYLSIGSLQSFFSQYGAETDHARNNQCDGFWWPAEFGQNLSNSVSNSFWIGTTNYMDMVSSTIVPFKVVGVGPRYNDVQNTMVFGVEHSLIGKIEHPLVIVDGVMASQNDNIDQLDLIDETLISDRMLVTKLHTSVGVTMSRKIMAFSQQYHDNYFIFEYTFKNTGIIDELGTVSTQTLNNLFFYFQNRYAPGGREPVPSFSEGWGIFSSSWGINCVNQVINTGPEMPTMQYSWYGPHSERPVSDDWGCPNQLGDGVLGAVQYIGFVTLHTDKSASDHANDPNQPTTTHFIDSDEPINAIYSQYDQSLMQAKYEAMTLGHAAKTHADEVGDGFADLWGSSPGGYSQAAGYGPYTLQPGDSIRIVIAEGVAGINRELARQVGSNWLSWWQGEGTPTLINPDGSTTTNYDAYKTEWVQSGEDSILKTFDRAIATFNNGINIPQPPPPPDVFEVNSGGDRIRLSWSDNADSWFNFDGYRIYRSHSHVLDPQTEFELIFECNAADNVHTFDDIAVTREIDYYYYIQSKDDGSTNDIQPGMPLVSSKFWTMTNQPARLVNVMTVYPGDTDNNGIVDAMDVLPIGIYFLQETHARDSTDFTWKPHQNIFTGIIEPVYADANGDGIVDAKDVIGIGVNWGNTHNDYTLSYTIDSEDIPYLMKHRMAFQTIYNSLSGENESVRLMKALIENILGIDVPKNFLLYQNYPNPFNPETQIRFSLPEDQDVSLVIYNLLGQEIRVLIDHQMYKAGNHTITLAGDYFANGIYFYHIKTEKWQYIRKMAVVK